MNLVGKYVIVTGQVYGLPFPKIGEIRKITEVLLDDFAEIELKFSQLRSVKIEGVDSWCALYVRSPFPKDQLIRFATATELAQEKVRLAELGLTLD